MFPSQFRTGKYDLRYGKDVTHVLSQSITPTYVIGGELDGKKAMKIEADITFDLAALVDGQVKNENTVGTIGFTSTKDPTTGKWRISGYNNTFSTTPLK